MTIRNRLLGLLMLLLLPGCTSIERLALPQAVLADGGWVRHDAASTEVIDHAPWQAFLDAYVETDHKGVNRVEYGAVSARDRGALKRYLDALQAVPIHRYRRDEQLAYWVNLYNAKTVDLVLDHYPVSTIRDIKLGDGLVVIGPWGAPVLRVTGHQLSLNDIEHTIIRPIWQDQRVHYVLNCAAVGCPNLGRKAYRGDSIDIAMTTAAIAYVNDPRGVRIDGHDRLQVSKIYGWFREDFGGDGERVLMSIARYALPELKVILEAHGRIDRYIYDWSLNDAKTSEPLLNAWSLPLHDRQYAQQGASPAIGP